MNDPIIVDARGRACPMPIVMIAKASRKSEPGDTLLVLADDRAFPKDVEAWCSKTGNQLAGIVMTDGAYRATIQRR